MEHAETLTADQVAGMDEMAALSGTINEALRQRQAFTAAGYTVADAERARTVLLMAKLQGCDHVARQAQALVNRLAA